MVEYLCCSNNAFHNGELGKKAVVYAIFQMSSCLSDSHGWLLVSCSQISFNILSICSVTVLYWPVV